MQVLNLEALGVQIDERFAQLMVRLEPSGERIDDPLPESNDRIRALDVLDEHQTAAGSQHSVGLRYRAAIIRDRAQRQGSKL
jgi:hypothetical protein